MQTGQFFVRFKFEVQILDEELENVQRKMEGVSYKAKVGSLMYAMMATKADIAFAVSTITTRKPAQCDRM
jgi:hypothetical protein